MTKTILVLGSIAAIGAAPLCDLCGRGAQAQAAVQATSAAIAQEADSVTLNVEGMTCGGCVIGVRKVLEKLDGVTKTDVSYEKKRAIVTFDKSKVTVEQMVAAIKTLGYTATVAK